MTEAEWLACEDPEPMMKFLRGQASDRKLRLFAVACCRSIWQVLTDEIGREAVGVAERFADGMATQDELLDSGDATAERLGEIHPPGRDDDDYSAYCAVTAAFSSLGDDKGSLMRSANEASLAVGSRETERSRQGAMVRDIFGNPFRPVAFDPAWRTDTAVAIAAGMYESRDFGAMPILADALQNAGCASDEVLNHCRDANQVHVRGCWVIDLVLGKE